MKSITLVIALLLSITFSKAQEQDKGQTITVTINDISNNNGHVIVSLHTENTFMKGGGIQTEVCKITDGKITASFKNVTSGVYAIMALHDANDSKSMDFNGDGRPAESYGMSNNPMLMGPPQFADAKFELTEEDLNLKIIF